MSEKMCEKGKQKGNPAEKKFCCKNCGLASNKEKKLCKPKKQ
ncbi:MAG TPA: hypothetical protein PLC17_02205 [Tenuifilaceae bacterium]|jgi:hypothetical protein|nr:hypothetical protein [Tenuifilaceae bacterium]HQB77366.1 hypothetical protein [Tenuifilaceae bacterium]